MVEHQIGEFVTQMGGLEVATIQHDTFSMLEVSKSRDGRNAFNLTVFRQYEDRAGGDDLSIDLTAHEAGLLATILATSPTPAAEGIVELLTWLDDEAIGHEEDDMPITAGKYREAASLIASLTAEREGLTKSLANPWCPDVCPITQRPFFMWIDGEPTYGGPFDSYTIPTRDAEGEYSCRRYDHDEGGWKPWDEGLSLRVLTEEEIFDIEARAETAEASLATAREALEQITTGRDKDGLKVDFPAIIAGQALDALKGAPTP